ncbi:MAG: PKD domain-containing protein, partial [Bacteroidota bacterium]
VTYICSGNNTYTFFMEVYRDCNSGGAEFDNPAKITIYRQDGNQYTEITTQDVFLIGDDIEVPQDGGPCIVPVDVCVSKNSYIFSIDLPLANGSYHLVYQRCCRNNSISNLIDPGSQGATYTIEINNASQASCNSSPVFNDFPPIVICANEPIDFDHSATDVDGDQLVYTFCSPSQGGGLDGSPQMPTGVVTSCTGVAPDPGCPPPFDPVFYTIPTYTASSPMGGNPVVSINPNTGLITGVPEVQGQFVVGVCVEEFRAGVWMGTVRRDFQFNVTSCSPLIEARLAADTVINNEIFILNACGDSLVAFDNQSIGENFVDEQFWAFDLDENGTFEQNPEWEPVVQFPGIGTYNGLLVLNPGTTCNDTAQIIVNVYPGLNSDFSFTYDTCVSGPVSFTNLAQTNADSITDWFWDFGEGNISDEPNPDHLYEVPGNHLVSLVITDNNNCQDTLTKLINYFPAPAVVIVEPNTFIGCQPANIFFNNLSFPIDESYDLVWDFGDGNTSGEISPTHTYQDTGIYDVSLEITSPIGCFASESWDDWIEILPSPIADFSFTPEELNIFDNVATFTDLSFEPASWDWMFDDDGFSIEQNPVFAFPDTGRQVVQLVVTHESGCTDTAIQILDIVPQVRYFLPNAFTPNNDDVNDFFLGNGILDGMRNFR